MRIALGGISHETNTYADAITGPTDLDRFVVLRGDQLLNVRGTATFMAGFLDGCDEIGAVPVPTLWAWAGPSGTVALAIEQVNRVTDLAIRSVVTMWAGLRTFAPDRNPVVGFDRRVPGLFWLAGQGGYGIQTAPALARLAAALVRDDTGPPAGLDDVDVARLDPAREVPGRPL